MLMHAEGWNTTQGCSWCSPHLGRTEAVCCCSSTERVPERHTGLVPALFAQHLAAVCRQDAGQHLQTQAGQTTVDQEPEQCDGRLMATSVCLSSLLQTFKVLSRCSLAVLCHPGLQLRCTCPPACTCRQHAGRQGFDTVRSTDPCGWVYLPGRGWPARLTFWPC